MARRGLSGALIVGSSLSAMLWGRAQNGKGLSDWLDFEFGARVLLGWPRYAHLGGTPLRLYANNPSLQIGPPAFTSVAGVQWLKPRTGQLVLDVVMALLGAACILLLVTGPDVRGHRRERSVRLTVAGVAAAGAWGCLTGLWHHVDDLLAVSLAGLAAALIIRKKAWWAIALLLGTAAASKPWAVVLLPMLFGLERRDRAKGTLLSLGTAAAWWAPFVLAAPSTARSLGSFNILPTAGSTLYLLGIHGDVSQWLRPVQMLGGIVTGIVVARRGHWWAAPLAGLAFRVATDPYAWLYYALGPIGFALLWEVASPAGPRAGRRTGVLTGLTIIVTFLFPALAMELDKHGVGWVPSLAAALKLAWAIMIVLVALRGRRDPAPDVDPELAGANLVIPEQTAHTGATPIPA